MKDAYTKLMVQQHTSPESDAAFFHKLKNAETKKKLPVWKTAMAVVCIFLLIPVTVLATKYILHKPLVTLADLEFKFKRVANYGTFKGVETVKSKGYEIEYPDLSLFDIRDIPKQYRNSDETTIAYNGWEEAADALDIGVLKNTFLSDESVILEFCEVESRCIENRPYALFLKAQYQADDLVFIVTATIGIEHPDAPEEEYAKLRKSGSSMAYRNRPMINNKDYTTDTGIPVIISSISTPFWYNKNFALYDGDFAVNNIKYNINFPLQTQYNFHERNYMEDTEALIVKILEGFTYE